VNELAQRRYVLFLLFLVSMFNYIDRTIISILQVPIKQDLGLSDAQLGALTGLSFALFYSTLSLPIARWADRTVRKRIVAASLAIWSAMTAFTGLANSFATLVLFRIGVAVGEAGSVPATHSIMADIYPPRQRATAFAIWGLSLPVGMMIGYLLAGALAEAVGWRAAFALFGIVGVVLAPIVLFSMREPKRGRFDPPAVAGAVQPKTGEVLRYLWQLKTFRLVIAAGACHAYAQYSIMNWNAPFYVRLHGMSLGEVSAYLALMNGLGSAVGMYLGGWLSDRFGARDCRRRLHVPALALILMVPFALAQYQVDSVTLSIAFGAVASTLMLFYYGPIVAVPQLLVPASMRAFTSAVLLLTFNLFGLGLGPFITGLISDVLASQYGMGDNGLRVAICSAVTFSLLAGWLFLRASAHLPREMLGGPEHAEPPIAPKAASGTEAAAAGIDRTRLEGA
jgi:MFS family permease